MSWRTHFLGATFLSALFLFLPAAAPANEVDPKLADVASSLTSQASTQIFPESKRLSVVVLDFRDANESFTGLGVQLADELTQALRENAPNMTILDRAAVKSAMNDDCLR